MSDTNEIIFLGDSLTEWGNWPKLFPKHNILNYGIAGNTTTDIINRLKDLKQHKPNKLFFMAGINDLGDQEKPENIFSNYENIFHYIKKEFVGLQLHILSVLPVHFNMIIKPAITPGNIQLLNSYLKKLAISNQAIFINMAPAFSDNFGNLNPLYTNDGLHLNTEGYLIWKQEIEKYIQ